MLVPVADGTQSKTKTFNLWKYSGDIMCQICFYFIYNTSVYLLS